MTQQKRLSGPKPLSDLVAHNIEELRKRRKLTLTRLTQHLAEQGQAIPILGVRRIIGLNRRVDVDELEAFGRVFGVYPWNLTRKQACLQCLGAPPRGFKCNTCGTNGADA